MELIDIQKIVPDTEQPRKDFNAEKMFSLKKSVEKLGIKSPISVMRIEGGKYMIIDGERRYRTALDLGLKKVPAVIEEDMSETDRLVIQFNIQEQHAEWSPLEKAQAITKLAERLDGTVKEICEMLGMSVNEQKIYNAFAGLSDKEYYVRNEVPLAFAPSFQSMRAEAKKLKTEELGKEFTKADEKALEKALIRSIKDGSLTDKKNVTRLKDAFIKNPKLIDKYIEDKNTTPEGLFIEANAMGQYNLRNVALQCNYIGNFARRFLENPDASATDNQIRSIRFAHKALGDMIKIID